MACSKCSLNSTASRVPRAVESAVRRQSGKAHPVADPENPLHVAAPMPGSVVTVAVAAGQRVTAGSVLVSLEAMKMETHITAERDCVVKAVHVSAGARVAAKDLLIELQDIGEPRAAITLSRLMAASPPSLLLTSSASDPGEAFMLRPGGWSYFWGLDGQPPGDAFFGYFCRTDKK
ncbi:biotin/lipoyl-containing protein [Cupriavidus basilensis]